MSLSFSFAKAAKVAGAGLLATAILAGCTKPQAPENAAGIYAMPETCAVVVVRPHMNVLTSRGYATTYDFKNGIVAFNTSAHNIEGMLGMATNSSTVVPMKSLAEDGQAAATQMFSHLPPSANCKAPKFG